MNRFPIFATAFRLFFLACAVHAGIVILLWVLKLHGYDLVSMHTPPLFWHTYEMIFGFCRAAIFGFLFTAGQHWSGKFLLGGGSLLSLFALWLAGRFAFFFGPSLAPAFLALDTAANLLALYRLRHLLEPQQKHNHSVVYLMLIYTLTQAAAGVALLTPAWGTNYLHIMRLGLFEVILFIVIIAGRILPFFASVVIQGAKPRIFPRLEKSVWPFSMIFLGVFAAFPWIPHGEKIVAVLLLVFALQHVVRWLAWRPVQTFRMPILGILYLGYFWMIVGFALLAFALLGWLPVSPAWHMLGIGAAGIFIFGMMTRVALGHTGRPIKASVITVAAYFALGIALLARTFLPLVGLQLQAYDYAAAFWLVAFIFYLLQYGTILIGARVDNKPG